MASKLTTIGSVIKTQVETTSIEKLYMGWSSDSSGKLIAELTWSGGENDSFGNNVTNRRVSAHLRISGSSFDEVDAATEEIMVLFRDTADTPWAALSGAGVDWISDASQDPPTTFPDSHQEAVAWVQFELRMPYTH